MQQHGSKYFFPDPGAEVRRSKLNLFRIGLFCISNKMELRSQIFCLQTGGGSDPGGGVKRLCCIPN